MSTQRGKMDTRISCTKPVRDTLSGVIKGAGIKYDDLLRWFLESLELEPVLGDDGEIAGMAKGIQLRGKIPNYDAQREAEEVIYADKVDDTEDED